MQLERQSHAFNKVGIVPPHPSSEWMLVVIRIAIWYFHHGITVDSVYPNNFCWDIPPLNILWGEVWDYVLWNIARPVQIWPDGGHRWLMLIMQPSPVLTSYVGRHRELIWEIRDPDIKVVTGIVRNYKFKVSFFQICDEIELDDHVKYAIES